MERSTFWLGCALLALTVLIYPAATRAADLISPPPVLEFFDNNGAPLAGGKLFTYSAGTTSKTATFTDYAGGTPNTNPIILNARGEARVWLTPGQAYKFVLSPATDSDPPTNAIWTIDDLNEPLDLSGAGVTGVLGVSHLPSLNQLGSLHGAFYSAPGSYEFQIPAPGLKAVVVGAGGGGGGGNDTYAGAGGGSGGFCYAYLTGLTVGNSLAVTVGVGGTGGGAGGGGAGNNGSAGASTSVVGGPVNIIATGGSPGAGASSGASSGGATGNCSGGTVNSQGLPGQSSIATMQGLGGIGALPGSATGGTGGPGGNVVNPGVNGVGGAVIIEWIQ